MRLPGLTIRSSGPLRRSAVSSDLGQQRPLNSALCLMQVVAIVSILLLSLGVGFYTSSRADVRDTANLGNPPPNHLWSIIAAVTCIPAGFGLPLLLHMQGLEVWPLAIGIWLTGAGISAACLLRKVGERAAGCYLHAGPI